MKGKRFLAAMLALCAFFSLVACKQKKKTSVTAENTTAVDAFVSEAVADTTRDTVVSETVAVTASQSSVQTSSQMQSVESTVSVTEAGTTAAEVEDAPGSWSTERIIEEYKSAARQSDASAKSTQKILLKSISVNNGEYENVMSFVGGIIGKFLESNSTVKDGITGGYESLAPQDVSSARAYKQGNDTVIEMYMVEQTSGAKEDALSGSVGHAITTVGDISTVVNDLSERGLPLELSEDETKIYYTNPSLKVTIDQNGEIVSGIWFYTVEIKMDNFKAFGQNVNTASITMDNTITI